MSWTTPTLRQVRTLTRDFVNGSLPGADAAVPNSVLRVVSDSQAGLAHLNLQYLDWLALQLLPDTAETEFLDRHGKIWLVNSDGSRGRKGATFASGSVTFTGLSGLVIPQGSQLTGASQVAYETVEEIIIGSGASECAIRALDAGSAGNQDAGASLSLTTAISGVDSQAVVVELIGGTDIETDDDLRARVLQRIQQPPMGGDADDYVAWTLAVPGVTRAWCAPREMGMGTVTVRFMCDALRAGTLAPTTDGYAGGGLPLAQDIAAVAAYLDIKRPVAVKDFFVVAPLPEFINFTVSDIEGDSLAVRAAGEASVAKMLKLKAKPASQEGGIFRDAVTIHQEWVSEALLASGMKSFNLTMTDHVMPSHGHFAVLGTVTYP